MTEEEPAAFDKTLSVSHRCVRETHLSLVLSMAYLDGDSLRQLFFYFAVDVEKRNDDIVDWQVNMADFSNIENIEDEDELESLVTKTPSNSTTIGGTRLDKCRWLQCVRLSRCNRDNAAIYKLKTYHCLQ